MNDEKYSMKFDSDFFVFADSLIVFKSVFRDPSIESANAYAPNASDNRHAK